MKFIVATCLAGSLVLAGCAGTDNSASSSTSAKAGTSAGGTGARPSGSATPVYPRDSNLSPLKIGRASCRERV